MPGSHREGLDVYIQQAVVDTAERHKFYYTHYKVNFRNETTTTPLRSESTSESTPPLLPLKQAYGRTSRRNGNGERVEASAGFGDVCSPPIAQVGLGDKGYDQPPPLASNHSFRLL